jgi:hypothetical protein
MEIAEEKQVNARGEGEEMSTEELDKLTQEIGVYE